MTMTPEERAESYRQRASKRNETLARKKAAEFEGGQGAVNPLFATEIDEASPPIQYVYGEIEPPRSAIEQGEPEPPKDTGFALFLLSLDAETRELLEESELREIYATQLAKAKAEKRAAKRGAAIEAALSSARMSEGMVPAEARAALELMRFNQQPMRLKIQLPPADENGNVADIGLRIDQRVLLDGHTIPCTRAEFDSWREMLYRASQHELEFLGMSKRRRAFFMNQRLGHDPRWHIDMDMGTEH